MAVQLAKRLLSVEHYHKMGELEMLPKRGVELINGEIINMSPIGSSHAGMVDKLKDLLVLQLFGKAIVRVQSPVGIDDLSEPEPDIAIVKFRPDYYKNKHPQSKDVWVVIEVAKSSLAYDRESKLPLYAASGIPEYWIVDIQKQRIEIYQHPFGKDYKIRKFVDLNDELRFPPLELRLKVSAIF